MNRHPPSFQVAFIYTALAIAIGAGLVLGTHIALPIGFGWDIPDHLSVWIQVHGHLQLVGWVGLFVIGVSLYFLPRLLKASPPSPGLANTILFLVAAGLVTRSLAEFLIAYTQSMHSQIALAVLPLSAIAEWVGIMLYLSVLLRMVSNKGPRPENIGIVLPFFLMMALGFFVYESMQLAQVFLFDVSERLPWNDLSVEGFIAFALLPVSIAFAIKTFPLFLQVPPVQPSMYWFGIAYFLVALLLILAQVPGLRESRLIAVTRIENAAQAIRSVIIVWILWNLKLYQKMLFSGDSFLLKYFGHGYVKARSESTTFQRSREGYYDFGQFGRFELLLFSAFCWLTFYALLNFVDAGSSLLGIASPFGQDPVRHAFLLGFITLLIMGMGVRMLPGFVQQAGIAYPKIVFWLFVLGNLAAGFRVLPVALPASWFEFNTNLGNWMMYSFGLAGLFAILTLSLFTVCLVKTLRGGSRTWHMKATP